MNEVGNRDAYRVPGASYIAARGASGNAESPRSQVRDYGSKSRGICPELCGWGWSQDAHPGGWTMVGKGSEGQRNENTQEREAVESSNGNCRLGKKSVSLSMAGVDWALFVTSWHGVGAQV